MELIAHKSENNSQSLIEHLESVAKIASKFAEEFNNPDWTSFVVPSYKCDYNKLGINSEAAIIIDYENHEAVIAGSAYCGEIKKLYLV